MFTFILYSHKRNSGCFQNCKIKFYLVHLIQSAVSTIQNSLAFSFSRQKLEFDTGEATSKLSGEKQCTFTCCEC